MNDPIDTREGLEQIEDFLINQRERGGVVIIDSLHAALTKSQTRDARQVRKLITPLKRVAERAGTIILIHHTNAYGTRIADHTQLQAAVSQTILMTYKQRDHCRIIKWQSYGRGANATQTLHIASTNETTFKPRLLDPLTDIHPQDESTKPILKALKSGSKTVSELVVQTGLTAKRSYKRLAILVATGHVKKVGNTFTLA